MLEDFNDLQFTSALEFETLDLCHFSSMVEYSVSFLEHFIFFSTGRYQHALVRSINLEEDRHFVSNLIQALLLVYQSLVLRVSVLIKNEFVRHRARKVESESFARGKLESKCLWEALRQQSPNAIRVQL